MSDAQFRSVLDAANAPLTDPAKNLTIGAGKPIFELYHFALSVCSHKVRTCLAEKAAPYVAHDINVQPGNYHPDYIRLRMRGGQGRRLARGYSGQSSMGSEGFDPAVVPTLVDLRDHSVHVDSVHICNHIDRTVRTGTDLNPLDLQAAIDAEVGIVDRSPHVAMLYGAHPDGDFRPKRLRGNMADIHNRKIAKLRLAQDAVGDDPLLIAALDAKIAKETAGREFVSTPDDMRNALADMLGIVAALDDRLADRLDDPLADLLDDGRNWVCGDQFTMADVMWAVSLFRMQWIGIAFCWTGGHALNQTARPNVAAYARRLFARPSFQSAVIHWPGIPKSEYVAEFYR